CTTPIDCGESGATLRFLTAIAGTSSARTTLRASVMLAKRPLEPLLKAMETLGASTTITENREGSEVKVHGPLKGGETWIQGDISSQFISGLLFAAPLAANDVTIHVKCRLESRRYVEMSLDAMNNPDLVPPLEVLGCFARGISEIRGVERLRYKETNRLQTIPAELGKMGAKISVDDDVVKIMGGGLVGCELDSKHDHRVAMS